MPEKTDPFARLPTWQLACLLLATACVVLSGLYLIGAVLVGWPGVPAGIVLLCAGGLATGLLMPRRC